MNNEVLVIWGMLATVGVVGLGIMVKQYRDHLESVNEKLTASRELVANLQSENANLHSDLITQEQVCQLTQEIIKIVRDGTVVLPSAEELVD